MTTKPAIQSNPSDQRPRLTPLPGVSHIFDMLEQGPHVSRAYLILEDHFLSRPDAFVGMEGWLCDDASEAGRAPRPDCLVSFGVDFSSEEITSANGYVINEIGKPPDFVLEVASQTTGRRDYVEKREIYAGYRVSEYWRFDHTGGQYHDAVLAGDRLVDDRYEPIPLETRTDGIIRGYSGALQLELHWHLGLLRFWNPATGDYLPDLTETKAQLDVAQQRAQDAETRAEEERAARLSAEARITELEAELNRRQSER